MKTLSNISALVRRDLLDAARNPTLLMMVAACALMSLIFARVVESGTRFEPDEGAAFLLASVLACAPSFVGCVVTLYVIAEERERGMRLTLAEAGVTVAHYAIAKLVTGMLLTLATEVLMLAVARVDIATSAAFLACSVVAALPVLLMGLAGGLVASEQMSSSVLAVPIALVAVVPLLSFVSDEIRAVSWMLPMGPAAELLRSTQGIAPAAPVPLLVLLALVWTIACGGLAVWACGRFARDLEAARNRLA